MSNKKILVTTALDYANGDLHLGHILEKIQADIWVRWQRLLGKEIWFICGDDAHGTPIMLKARQQNISPEELIANYYDRHLEDLQAFGISFDNFYTTHSQENQTTVYEIYTKLRQNKDIFTKNIEQLYDQTLEMFLPDRYVKGTCPKCGAKDQYGDNCESCSSHYQPLELIDPISILSNTTPIIKTSEHYFFDLPKYKAFLIDWLATSNSVAPSIVNKLNEWLNLAEGLKAWDISRDPPYFGFLIPETTDRYFYVWLDAPIGYLAIVKNLCKINSQIKFEDFFVPDNDQPATGEFYHFIGKDIIYFHTLFWPAMLQGAGLNLPKQIFVHGFLTINGEKMSKSRGTFITAKQFYQHVSPEYLRYYLAAKLSNGIEDLDFNLDDFVKRINADLVGKLVNIASRCAGFMDRYFDNMLASNLHQPEIYAEFIASQTSIAELFLNLEYSKAIKTIMHLADLANKYIDTHKPWQLIKQPNNHGLVQTICTTGLNLFRVLMIYLSPVLPQTAKLAADFLNIDIDLGCLAQPLLQTKINQFQPLACRIGVEQVMNIFSDDYSKKDPNIANTSICKNIDSNKTPDLIELSGSAKVKANVKVINDSIKDPNAVAVNINSASDLIELGDFAKVDLRVAKIIAAEDVKEAAKLLKLTVDVGELGIKQVFAGIKAAYNLEDLIGKCTVIVANLKERKMRFGVSQGMIIAASAADGDGSKLWILEPHLGAEPGMRIK